jgi:ATP-binding cassette, subfamily C, bacterial PrsD
MTRPGQPPRPASLTLKALRLEFLGVGIFSGVINILMLTGSIYMLQVYDRVLSSRSVPTLIGISAIVLAAFILQGVLDAIRMRMLARIGGVFEEKLSPLAYEMARTFPLRGARADQAVQGVRDIDVVRGFLGSLGPTAFFDMPFMPIFFAACFLLHPHLGLLALVGGVIIVALTLWTERTTKKATLAMTQAGAERNALLDSSRRNAEALKAMGMGEAFQQRWKAASEKCADIQLGVSNATADLGSAAKIFRMAFQSAVLGYGAYLVIQQQMTPGAMIAASILTSRALAPIETAVAHWKGFVAARQSLTRLDTGLAMVADKSPRTRLPDPRRSFTAEDLAVGVPGRQNPLVVGASFALKAGQGLLIIGQSGSGKSTLVRVLAGVWPALRGTVRVDGAAIDQWDPGQLGEQVGYIPQDVELFEGTISENIARFRTDVPDAEVVAAAMAAGAHQMILKLPAGYETRLGEGGATLSGGQRQRVGLARALFGNPFLLILDEPNSNLDQEGEAALSQAIAGAKERGAIVVVVSHKTALLGVLDFVGRVHDGRFQAVTREEYHRMAMRAAEASRQPGKGADVREQMSVLRAATELTTNDAADHDGAANQPMPPLRKTGDS